MPKPHVTFAAGFGLSLAAGLAGCAHRDAPSPASVTRVQPARASATTLLALGRSAQARGDLASALSFDRAAHHAAPDDPLPLLYEGEIAEQRNQFDRARLLLAAYIARRPQDVQGQAELGIAELASGHPRKADRWLAPIARGSNDPRILRNAAVARDLLGDPAAAEALDRRAIALDPTDPVLRANLALSLAAGGNALGGEHAIDQALALPRAPGFVAADAVMLLAFAGKTDIARSLGERQFGAAVTSVLLSRAARARTSHSPAGRATAFGLVTATVPPPER
jgi:Flp pilus assembly protein TadD